VRALLVAALALLVAGASGSVAAPRGGGPDLAVILAERPAVTLAEYRLFLDPQASQPNAGVTPYDLAVPLFSDYADKDRLVFLPAGTKVSYRSEGSFEFPIGAVLIKTFRFATVAGDRKIETRLLVRKRGGWAADTYVWNASGQEARLQVAGSTLAVDVDRPGLAPQTVRYAVPNRNQCKGCHSVDGALAPIGPSAPHFTQISATHPETETARWVRLGLLEGAPAASLAPSGRDAAARAYLDINCAHCHNPRGPANTSGLDLRASQTDPSRWGVRKRPIAAGRASADLEFSIDPGRPERSILLHRMKSDDPGVMMPELGRSLVHAEGVELVRAWIAQMDADGRPRAD
jgi:uncharacterized repeat protein (TIGR03806 family)